MKKLFTLCFAVLASVAFTNAEVYSGTCGKNLTWTMNTEDSTLVISGSGDMDNWRNVSWAGYPITFNTPWDAYKKGIKSISLPEGLTSIGSYAFGACTNLERINIPENVVSIGQSAISYCWSIKEFSVSPANQNYIAIDGILFSKDQETIVYYPATKNDASYIIPNTVRTIGNDAFARAKFSEVTIPNTVTKIGAYAFYGCRSIKNIIIPNSVVTLGEMAFCDCSSLSSVTLSDKLKELPERVFGFCSIKSIELPIRMETIGSTAFYSCPLISIDIPANVTLIKADAFLECSQIFAINVAEDNTTYSSIDGILFNKDKNILIKYPSGRKQETYSTPDCITELAGYAFDSAKKLKKVIVNEGVNNIGFRAFSACSALETILLPSTLQSIETQTFANCSALKTINIPQKVTQIGLEAFFYCTSLSPFTIPNTVASIGSRAFYEVPLIIYNGNASGAPWGAKRVLKECLIEGNWIYENNTKQTLIGYLGNDEILSIPSRVKIIGEKIIIPQNRYSKNYSIKSIEIPNGVKDIGDSAFYNCVKLTSITCYSKRVPTITEHTFDGIDQSTCILYVLADYHNNYVQDYYWGDFDDIRPLGATSTTTDEVNVEPSETTVDVTWPIISGATSYELVIKDKQGNVICTLIFNEKGQLTQIAFSAPSRNGAPQHTQIAGFSFTITGLSAGTAYDLTITAKDSNGNPLDVQAKSFFTTGTATSLDQTSQQPTANSQKLIKDGQILILRGSHTYTLTGQEVK